MIVSSTFQHFSSAKLLSSISHPHPRSNSRPSRNGTNNNNSNKDTRVSGNKRQASRSPPRAPKQHPVPSAPAIRKVEYGSMSTSYLSDIFNAPSISRSRALIAAVPSYAPLLSMTHPILPLPSLSYHTPTLAILPYCSTFSPATDPLHLHLLLTLSTLPCIVLLPSLLLLHLTYYFSNRISCSIL